MFYSNTIDYTPWSEYAEYFGFEPSSATLSLSTLSGGYCNGDLPRPVAPVR